MNEIFFYISFSDISLSVYWNATLCWFYILQLYWICWLVLTVVCVYVESLEFFYIWSCMLKCFSHVQFFATLWTVACLSPLSMGFSRETYWSGLPSPPPGDLSNPGIQSVSLTDALTGRLSLAPPINCEKGDNFTFSSMIWMPFVSISRLVALVRLPVLCWVGTIRVATFVLFLILEEMFSMFHGWIWY